MKNVSNELESGGAHQAVRVNAQSDVVNRFAAMDRFRNHELLVFGPGKLSGQLDHDHGGTLRRGGDLQQPLDQGMKRFDGGRIRVALIGCAVVLMEHAEFLREPEETFRMADEEIARRIQAVPEFFNQTLLLGFVEIDHDVAAKDDVVAARQEFRFQVVKVELDEFLELRLDGVLGAGLFEITQPAGVVDRLHLLIGIKAFLSNAKTGVADVRSHDFDFPGRRDQRFRRRHFKRKRIAQVVVGQRITNQNGDGVRLLSGGASGAPDTKGVIAALLFATENFFENGLLQQIELGAISKETGFVDGQVFEEKSELRAAFPAGQQTIVGVEGIELTGLEAALQPILQEMRAALIEKHAAFLIDESLQEFQLGFGELDLGGDRSHRD